MGKTARKMEIDGAVVDVRPIPLEELYAYGDGTFHYRQKSLYEVYVNDVLRGYLTFPKGWGGKWELLSLRPKHNYDPVWAFPFEGDVAACYKALTPGSLNEIENWGEHSRVWPGKITILDALPKLVALGRLPTAEEAAAQWAVDKEAYDARQRKDAADKIRWAAERVANDAETERVRSETEEGLQSILDRAQSGELRLTNFETEALQRALKQWRKTA